MNEHVFSVVLVKKYPHCSIKPELCSLFIISINYSQLVLVGLKTREMFIDIHTRGDF